MDSNPEEAKKFLLEHIIGLQKELQYKHKELTKAIAIQKLIASGLLFPDYEPNDVKLARRAQIESIENIDIKQENTTKNTIENRLQEQTNLIESLKQNILDLEKRLPRLQYLYEQFKNLGNDDRPPSGGIAPSPRPKHPSPNPKSDSAAVFPEE
ncbi:MAG: hypothetical protein ACFBSE_01700 [Prochloraceae cyanobacterium]